MATKFSTVEEYIESVSEERKSSFQKLRKTIQQNLPDGFEECINYNMLGYVVPKSSYPDGYHCDPRLPLPFMNIANQKASINLYHSGIYAKKELHDWFVEEYPKHSKYKLDMGKSCIRFKKTDHIPYDLVGELVQKMSMEEWIDIYEANVKK